MVQPFDKLQTEVCSPVAWRWMESSSSVRVWIILRSTSDILIKKQTQRLQQNFQKLFLISRKFLRESRTLA